MPKKVITRRQRKAAEAKRKAEEDARLESKAMTGGGDTASAGAATKVSSKKLPPIHANPLPEQLASTLPPLKLSRRQKKKAKRRTKKNLELAATKESDMRPSSSSALKTTLVDTISRIKSDTPSTWYDACKQQKSTSTDDPKPLPEQSNRASPFGTRLCRRIARRFRPIPEKNSIHHPKQKLDDNQPALRQLAALNRVTMNKNTQVQQEVFEALQECGKNPLPNFWHPPEQPHEKQQHDAAAELKIEKQAAEILEKYLQNYHDENQSKTLVRLPRKSKLKPTRFPQAAISKRKARGYKRDVDDKIIADSLAPQPTAVPMEQPPLPLKILGHTGYFIMSGTNKQIAQQLHDLEAQHVTIENCLLLIAGITEKVQQQLEDLYQNGQQILNHTNCKYAMLAPKRQRRPKRTHKHVQVDKAGRANANRKGNPKKQRGTILAPAAERSAATC